MFHALRAFFIHPDGNRWRGRRARALAWLFLFEFAVVLLGVLAAQLTQGWFAVRADRARAQEAVAMLHREAEQFARLAEFRLRTHECEKARIERLVQLADGDGRATPEDIATPLMPMPSITEWSDATRALVALHAGMEEANGHDGFKLLATMISERQRRLEDQWADFRLLSHGDGTLDDGERAAVRLAAARVAGLLHQIDNNARFVRQRFPELPDADATALRMAEMNHPCAGAATMPVSSGRD